MYQCALLTKIKLEHMTPRPNLMNYSNFESKLTGRYNRQELGPDL
jgi:hypothetical protein